MKTRVLASVLLLNLSTGAAAEPAPPARFDAPPSLRARLTDEAIKQAVRATLEQDAGLPDSAPSGTVLSGDRHRAFSRTFAEAKKPSCMGPDALKHQPSSFSTKNWNFSAGGLTALPFWAAAIARGKCQ